MAEGLVQLRNIDIRERQRMTERGRQWVMEHHDLLKLSLKLEEVLSVVTGQ
jgi:hypothetical protein